MSGDLRLDKVVTAGTFSLDGGVWEVDNNVWIVGDDDSCVVIDAAHDAEPILQAIGDRRVTAILLTHAHDDHIGAVRELREATGAPAYLHPEDRVLWEMTYPDETPDEDLVNGQQIPVAGSVLRVLHTPGHAPGACCFVSDDLGCVFTGDTLFQGGPGATGRSFSDEDTILDSIRTRLFALPGQTVVHTGHGDDTTIAAEKAALS
ncbi:MBL fold metallo-hydrolase [Calidifontibacter sp. DB0510]|uniref:MBL fold metallo-hydrolase n=1 Tax=Metallococcus carri TaxID=1656884 RepID=A0A967E8R9_9MICO|nr:MBL fold metallo-hydrolase [Metallococcus carri]NHN55532.1 MBL fold metallo-hydrolase [Metallococcus carri]NOP38284.1 MBL fold metallo-hydrolase [Calidifontibacter sp. DB2511S]